MAASNHLKAFKQIWGDSCESMWAELLSLVALELYVKTNYSIITKDQLIAEHFYAPGLASRLRGVTKDIFLSRKEIYSQKVITNRAVILSAAFESYFIEFLDTYIKNRPKLYDPKADSQTAQGQKFYGDIRKIRGLSNRIRKFSELAPAKIASIEPLLSYLDDIYSIRNIIAHNAGLVNTDENFNHVEFAKGSRIILTSEKLMELAAPVVKIAERLDDKI